MKAPLNAHRNETKARTNASVVSGVTPTGILYPRALKTLDPKNIILHGKLGQF